MKKMNPILKVTAAFALGMTCLTGCGEAPPSPTASNNIETNAGGGVLCLRVNPEIAITYDAEGRVTDLRARNEDGSAILADFGTYLNRDCREVVTDLVEDIGEAGYFVEEVEGEARQIVIEVEEGSTLPSDDFLDAVVADVQYCVSTNNWSSPINVEGESNYGVTNYDDTDYGTNSDGVTDYNADTDYGTNNDGVTDYADTDYGADSDGVTDYNDTDYGVGNDGITDYNDTDYGVGNDGITDYETSDYGTTTKAPAKTTTKVTATVPVSGDSGYDDTDYGAGSDGVTDYTDTDYGAGSDGVTDYTDTDYGAGSDGVTDYTPSTPSYSGDSSYSSYGDSAYDD